MYATFTACEQGGASPKQDDFKVETHPQDPSFVVCVVADGQGGAPGGLEAAQMACAVTLDKALARAPGELLKPGTWPGLLSAADEAVQASPQAGRTTLVALCIAGSVVVGASCGDSAAIVVRDGVTHELTRDQSKNPPVGSGYADVVPFAGALAGSWRVALMTDGAWARCGRDNAFGLIAASDGRSAIGQIENANRAPATGGLQDDLTLVIVQHQQPQRRVLS